MPVGYIVKENRAEVAKLQQRLTAEWSQTGTNPALFDENALVLIEDEQPVRFSAARQPLHLYVIWDTWADLPQQERSEIIMESYEATHQSSDIVRVTLAMGLTKSEAKKMGLNYQTVPPTLDS